MTDLKILDKAYVFLQINSNIYIINKNPNVVLTLDPTEWREGKKIYLYFVLTKEHWYKYDQIKCQNTHTSSVSDMMTGSFRPVWSRQRECLLIVL